MTPSRRKIREAERDVERLRALGLVDLAAEDDGQIGARLTDLGKSVALSVLGDMPDHVLRLYAEVWREMRGES